MKLVFCGTPEFAVPTLRGGARGRARGGAGGDAAGPAGGAGDGDAGAGGEAVAVERGLAVMQPEKIKKNAELRARLEAIQPDAILVVAYGRIIPQWMLELPRFGNINLHGSLLPKYRGAAPIQWAVANGETRDGRDDDAAGCGAGYGRYAAGAGGADWAGGDGGGHVSGAGGGWRGADGGDAGGAGGGDAGSRGSRIMRGDAGADSDAGGWADGSSRGRRSRRTTGGEGFMPWPGCYGEFRGKRFLMHRHARWRSDLPESVEPGELLVDE